MKVKLQLPKPLKLLLVLDVFLAVSLTILYSLLSTPTRAQVPPSYVSCDDVANHEFNSLRPYQKSPCEQKPTQTAEFCGNRLVLTDSVTRIQLIPPNLAPNCTSIGGGKYRCSYNVSQTANYKIDLANANFPILGNTEKELDDADKTNQYVSWYLHGVTGRAENSPLNLDNEEDARKLVDFSGPVNKLLPWEIQLRSKYETIKSAGEERHNQIVGCTDLLGRITACPGARQVRLSDLGKNGKPPYPSDFKTFKEFWAKYQEWRGNFCFTIPFTNLNLCLNNPFKPDYLANLYSYVPYSSTEDRVGLVTVDTQTVTAASEDLEISNASLTTTPADLYFSHTEEANQLGEILQATFVPDGNPTTGAPSLVSPTDACYLANVRTNEGDDLFAEQIEGNLSYNAVFSCVFSGAASSSACTKNVSVGLKVVTETPLVDDIWSRLVAGPSAIFKRIFPKVGEGGALLGILDMPGATNVSYSGSGLVSAGNPGERAGEDAELYFPHVGGISEYFLKGIQTILRPKGYGEQILSGAPGTFPSSGDIDCNQSAPAISLKNLLSKQDAFQLALNWIGGQTGNHVLECYNDTVGQAKDSGVNAAMVLLIWLNESNASNYDISPADFGIRALDNQGFTAQIKRFLSLPSSYKSNYPQCFGKGDDLNSFLRLFKSGNCTDEGGQKYADRIKSRWNWVTSCAVPKSPTDTSCPN